MLVLHDLVEGDAGQCDDMRVGLATFLHDLSFELNQIIGGDEDEAEREAVN